MKSPLVEEIRNNETLIANLTETKIGIDMQITAAQRKVDLLKAGLTQDEKTELSPVVVAPESPAPVEELPLRETRNAAGETPTLPK